MKESPPLQRLSLWARCTSCLNVLHIANLLEELDLREHQNIGIADSLRIIREHKYRKAEQDALDHFAYSHRACGHSRINIELTRGHVLATEATM